MANVFSDIFEAIRIIRQKKGTTESDIMTYVHDRLGKGVSIRTVLKTMKTLNRLVDEGLLCKRGRKYILPLPSDSGQEKKEEEEDECKDDEDDDEDENEGEGEGEEDEDEDDDDDDDDDGNGCNMEEDDGGNDGNGDKKEKKDPCEMDDDGIEERERKDERDGWDYKHMDSRIKKCMKSELNPVASSFIRSKKQRQGSRRNHRAEEYDDMSGSPAGKSSDAIDLMMDVEDGVHESEGGAHFLNSDLSFGYEEGDALEGYNVYRYKSPNGPPPPNTPGVHVDRKESCCSDILLKKDDLLRTGPDFTGDVKSKQPEAGDKKQVAKDRQSKRRAQDGDEEGCRKEKSLRRDESPQKADDAKTVSVCGLCKKKKPSGYDDSINDAGKW